MTLKPLLACIAAWMALALCASGQITVSLETPRSVHLADEPLKANLTIRNLAGRDILLEDNPKDGPWCLFQVKAVRGGYIQSRKSGLTFPPIEIPAGESITRSIDFAELYDINEAGQFRVRACINFPLTQKQFWSEPIVFKTESGKLLWTETVGIPDGRPSAGAFRTFSLISHQRNDGIFLYAKLEGKEEGIRYAAYPLGRVLAAMQPQTQLDDDNNLYVFHANSDTSYTLSQIDVATGKMGQALYKSTAPNRQGRPSLKRSKTGQLIIAGGARIADEELAKESSPSRARISDRPEGFEEKRP